MAPAPSKWIPNRQLNSLTAIAKPIYQHAHGPTTVRHLGSKIKGASTPVCCRRTGQVCEAPGSEFQPETAVGQRQPHDTSGGMMLHKLRRAMVARERSPLTGLIEVDET